MSTTSHECELFRDDLASVIDGEPEALERHVAHLVHCDECRDARHDARVVARAVGRAGEGLPTDDAFIALLLGAVETGAVRALEPAPQSEAPRAAEVASPEPRRLAVRPAARPAAVRRRLPRTLVALALAASLALAVGATALVLQAPAPIAPSPSGLLTARLDRVLGAGPAGAGVELSSAGTQGWASASEGARVGEGVAVRTDRFTRVRLMLSDGSSLVLDRDTEVALDAQAPRRLRLVRGVVLADVAHLSAGPRASVATPHGVVEVLGTKFVLTAADDGTHVDVLRGTVRLSGAEVRSGQEGTIARGAASVRVSASAPLATELGWSELDAPGGETGATSGLGVLRARRPGERDARDRPLSLQRHRVSVRIAGNVARTEVEEVFANDGPDVLEGTYEFPVPAGARIVRLALEVDGQLVEGAIVERDRGAKIMTGVTRQATPVAQRKPKIEEEWIWVPGPWRDPALLEWRAGGRFALRIYPIPARGARRVVLAYEELVPPRGTGRRWVYPLPQVVGPSTTAGRFELEAHLSGADPARPVVAHGYPAEVSRAGEAATVRLALDGFTPTGDFVLDWSTPNPDAELSTWTYRTAGEPRGWAALALRPRLPAWTESRAQDVAIVVDSSHSMRGERWDRAVALAERVVGEMDRRDRFLVLSCDTECRSMPGGARPASGEAAREVRAWLSGIHPAGASNLVGTVRAAARALEGAPSSGQGARVSRLLYLGDGIATVGFRQLGAVEAEVARAARDVTVTTVAIGGDADAQALGAIARAGRGQLVVWRPGESLATAALAVLETTQGTALEDPSLELPAGLEDVAPRRLPTLRAGAELVVGARLSGPVRGEVVLRGRIAGAPFERRWPLDVTPDAAAGNAFVPAVWAERAIAEIEREDAPDGKERIVALSKQYGVLSRHTSLIVLENEAMFRAFDVAHTTPMATWTGEEDPVATRSLSLAEPDDEAGHASGTEAARGSDAHGALDALMGDPIGESFGYGGLGMRGTGRGGGGRGEGTIGLGRLQSIGRGASVGTGAGYGRGAGGLRGRASVAPSVRAGDSAVHGSLSKELIRRVVRSHINEIRFCYERQLAAQPNLAGRVSVSFVISPSGSVQSATLSGSTLGDAVAEQCITRTIRRWSFPAPEGGGIVTVTYPFMLQSASEGTGDAPAVAPDSGSVAGLTGRPLGNGRFVRRTRLRTWERRAAIVADASVRAAERRAVTAAEAALGERPDSRDRHRDLLRALARAGEVERALTLAEAWVDKDPLDTEGITTLADALARVGRRDDAVRMLSGAVDAAPDDASLHKRLAAAFERLGATELACAHRESLAELSPADPTVVAAAVACERSLARPESAARVLARVEDAVVRARVEEAVGRGADVTSANGDLIVEARWEGGADLDLGIVGPRGARLSWLGGRTGVAALDVVSRDHERLALRRLPVGGFLVELARSSPAETGGPVRGQLEIRALGQRRVVPFVLDGPRETVARVDVSQVEVLRPLF